MGGEAVECVVDQAAQAALRHRDAQTYEAQESLGKDGGGDAEHQLGDDLADDVGQNFLKDNGEAARAQGAACQHELLFFQLEHLGPGDTAHVDPFGNDQRQHDGGKARLDHQQQQGHHHQAGNAVVDLHDTLHDGVHPAAEVTADQAIAHADGHVDGSGHNRNAQADTGAFPHTGPDVAAQRIGAEPVVCIGKFLVLITIHHTGTGGGGHGLVTVKDAEIFQNRNAGCQILFAQGLGVVVPAAHARAHDGHNHDQDNQNQRHHCAFVGDKAVQHVVPVPLAGKVRVQMLVGSAAQLKVFRAQVGDLGLGSGRDIVNVAHAFTPFFLPNSTIRQRAKKPGRPPSPVTRMRGSMIPYRISTTSMIPMYMAL